MKVNQVAAQLYTVRDYCRTAEDTAASLKKIAGIGYQAVQVSGIGPIPEDELAAMLAGEGLTCCATHEPGEMILSEPQKVADRLEKLNCRYTAYPYPAGVSMDTMDDVLAFAAKLDASGEALRKAGKVLMYHNHQIEFQKVEGRLILDTIYRETSQENLKGEIDTYWVQYGGGDPVDWCKRLWNRLPTLHMKDYAINAEKSPVFAEIGNGNLDWRRIVQSAEEAGCQWFIVEQDTCPGDPFDSLRMSFDYIRDNLCE